MMKYIVEIKAKIPITNLDIEDNSLLPLCLPISVKTNPATPHINVMHPNTKDVMTRS